MDLRQNITVRNPAGAGPVYSSRGAFAVAPYPDSIDLLHNRQAIEPFLARCVYGRADIIYVGDSNTYNASYGEKPAWTQAWTKRFRMYATGVMASNSQGGYSIDYSSTPQGTAVDGTTTVPATHTGYFWTDGHNPQGCFAMASDTNVGAWNEATLQVPQNHPSGTAGHLRWHFDYGTFVTGSGVFQPCVRYAGTLVHAKIGAQINTNTGSAGVQRAYLDMPAQGRSWQDFRTQFQVHSGTGFGYQTDYDYSNTIFTAPASYPFVSFFNRMEFVDVHTGISVSTLFYAGGEPTKTATQNLQAMTQTQFNTWIAMVVGLQNDDAVVCVQLVEGQNDGSDGGGGSTTNSLGPNPAPSNTVAGAVDNHHAYIIRFRELWVGAGYDVENAYFLLGPYHPQELTRLNWGRNLDEALNAFSDTTYNVAVASRSRIATSAYYLSRGWYEDVPGSDSHMRDANAQILSCELMCNAIYPLPNPEDDLVRTNRTVNGHALSSDVTVTATDVLPSQSGNSGKYLTTNGTSASWGTVSAGASGDLVSPLASAEISVAGATTATISRMHVCSGTAADYTVTLPAASGNAGKLVGFRMATGLTKLVTIDGNGSETIDGALTRVMWAGESAILLCDGTGWSKIAGKSIPMIGQLSRTTDQTGLTNGWNVVAYAAASGCPQMWDATNHRASVVRPAIYLVTTFAYLADVSGTMYIGFGVNGSYGALGYAQPSVASSTAPGGFSATFAGAAGDYVEGTILQGSGFAKILGAGGAFLNVIENPQW